MMPISPDSKKQNESTDQFPTPYISPNALRRANRLSIRVQRSNASLIVDKLLYFCLTVLFVATRRQQAGLS